MAAPTISATSSLLGFKRNEPFNFQFAATPTPLRWSAASFPPGTTVHTPTEYAATGVASTNVVTATGHDFADGDAVYFLSLTGGGGLSANTIYYVRDKAVDTLKLAATKGGPVIDFSTDISAAVISEISSGLYSCPTGISVAGPIVFIAHAINGDGTGTKEFTIGISPESAPLEEVDTCIDLALDIETGIVAAGRSMPAAAPAAQSDQIMAFLKSGDTRLFAVRCFKNGLQIDPDLTGLKMVFKEFAPESVLVEADDMEKINSGSSAVFRLAVTVTRSGVAGAISNNEDDKDSTFVARTELEWRAAVTHNAETLNLVGSSQTFGVRCSGDLATED